MTVLTHFMKLDPNSRTTTSTTPVEQTNFTISWANLTGAGLAAGDDVLIFIAHKHWNSSAAASSRFQIGFGTSYAGRTDIADSLQVVEPAGGQSGYQYIWFDRRTLVTSENIYFSNSVLAASTATSDEFVAFIIKLADLTANDFAYADATHVGDAPTTYGTTGASFTVPAAGNWLFFACSHWLIDSTTADFLMAIQVNGNDWGEVRDEGEQTTNEICMGTFSYASLSGGETIQVRFRSDTAATHDCDRTALFGLRLDAFANSWGTRTTNTVTHSVLDTYSEVAGNAAFTLSATGPLLVMCWPLHAVTGGGEIGHRPYGRVQLDGVDWVNATMNRSPAQVNGIPNRFAPLILSYAASQAAGTYDLDIDAAEDQDVSPATDCVEQVAAAFSLELAAGVVPTSLPWVPPPHAMLPLLVR